MIREDHDEVVGIADQERLAAKTRKDLLDPPEVEHLVQGDGGEEHDQRRGTRDGAAGNTEDEQAPTRHRFPG